MATRCQFVKIRAGLSSADLSFSLACTAAKVSWQRLLGFYCAQGLAVSDWEG